MRHRRDRAGIGVLAALVVALPLGAVIGQQLVVDRLDVPAAGPEDRRAEQVEVAQGHLLSRGD